MVTWLRIVKVVMVNGLSNWIGDAWYISVKLLVIWFVHKVYKRTVISQGLVLDWQSALAPQKEQFGLV